MSTLLILTHSFPYGSVEPFLETEIIYLAKHFNHIFLVPCRVYGTPRPVPANVTVETLLGRHWPKGVARGLNSALACVRSNLFYKELTAQMAVLSHWRSLARMVAYIGDLERLQKWAADFLARLSTQDGNIIIYTYWTGPLALASSSFKQQYPHLKVISRAHRIDLYEDIHPRNYLPLRAATLAAIDRVFVVSDHGKNYLAQHYPNVPVEVARLGVNDPGFITRFSDDGVFRIASCSYMSRVKRLDLLLEAVAVLARQNPLLSIEWHHMGGGVLLDQLETQARRLLPENARHIFHGKITNREVIEFYRAHPIDVFVNVSASEGVPVSIMEAQSCGIPVIATAVGGTPEIVTNENGILLENNPLASTVANGLERLVKSPFEKQEKSIAGRRTWQLMYNAEDNYSAFAKRLWALCET